jgi:hypothetical protein
LKFQLAIRLSASVDARSSLPLPVSHFGVCVGSQANGPPSQSYCVGWRQWPQRIGRAGQQAGADGGSRTRTGSPPQDFKSCVSTSSTTSASKGAHRIACLSNDVRSVGSGGRTRTHSNAGIALTNLSTRSPTGTISGLCIRRICGPGGGADIEPGCPLVVAAKIYSSPHL